MTAGSCPAAASGSMIRRVTMSRERIASVAPSIPCRACGPSAVRQWRLRHCEEIRVRMLPP